MKARTPANSDPAAVREIGCRSADIPGKAFALVMLAFVGLRSPARADTPDRPRPAAVDRGAADFFEASIRPVLLESCLKCHGEKKQSSGLRLDSRDALLKGGTSGPAVVPGKPDESLLVRAVDQSHDELKMPPKGKLTAPQVSAIRHWVEIGAPWGGHPVSVGAGSSAGMEGRSHWAFRPVRDNSPPGLRDRDWTRSPVDAFVLARLEREGLGPSAPASRRSLIRRATMDLVGIPPTAKEVDAFEADPSPDAFARLVERLLASPLYGERWGRHWLDVARYADTKGYVFLEERKYPYAYTYRDYVVKVFNRDVPFDRFIVQQIAADQLDLGGDAAPLAAMGFLTVGRRFLNDQNEIIDDRIDVVGRGFLGLSLGCARCHDHKYDPIPSEDYYSLYGVFASSVEPEDLPRLDPPGAVPPVQSREIQQEIDKVRKERDDFLAARRAELQRELNERFSRYLKAAWSLEFNSRHPGLEEKATAEKLRPQGLRAVISLWKRRLERADAVRDPVIGPWLAYAALPKDAPGAKAADVAARLLAIPKDRPGALHPLLARALKDHPPTRMDQVVELYADLLARLEERFRIEQKSPIKAYRPLSGSEWESLRRAVFGEGGIASVPADNTRLVLDRPARQKYTELNNKVQRAEVKSVGKHGRAMVMKDAPQLYDPRVFIRGNSGRPGKAVPRQFLKVVAGDQRRPFQKGSGRLELAQAIADPANPLTARVIVNRVWQWHFGQGLVATPSDFGTRSDPPSHPELLDWLTARFIESGWSIKTLHRLIMVSGTYQQASEPRSECLGRDPQNRLVWRFSPQRLDFEALRDSLLAVSGNLDLSEGGPSVAINVAPFPPRRTIYGFIDRQNLDGVYRTFDFAIPDATSPKRFVTTVPQQALFLMNSPFLADLARRLAATIDRECASRPPLDRRAATVRNLYRRVLGRFPADRELALGQSFLERQVESSDDLAPTAQLAQVLMLTNEFMFVD